jgi:hypothetical protein
VITYAYWALIIGLAVVALFAIGSVMNKWKAALVTSTLIVIVGWAAYFFHYQQVFVKHWGGVMSIEVPAGQYHIATTWKEDHLWVENYDPATNTCEFREYAKGNLLQGRVLIKNCNPLIPRQ